MPTTPKRANMVKTVKGDTMPKQAENATTTQGGPNDTSDCTCGADTAVRARAHHPRCGYGPLAVDLFCGRGGFTRSLLAKGYRVIGVDNEPQPDYPKEATFVQADVRQVNGADFRGARLIVASPPCTGFSIASRRVRDGLRPSPLDFELLAHALRIIGQAEPTYWAVENVGNAVDHFRPILGEPAFANRPWFLWGNFPPFLVGKSRMLKGFTHRGNGGHKVYGNASKKKRAAMAATIPSELSGPLAEACL